MTFKCIENCEAECCGRMLFEKSFLRANKSKIQRKFKKTTLKNGLIQPETEDHKCIFLNKEQKCEVYKTRPYICKIYGTIKELRCPFVDFDGRIRSKEESEKVREEIHRWIEVNQISYQEKYHNGKVYLMR